MTNDEVIAEWAYHTCGRCKYDDNPQDQYPCNACKWGEDLREDLWELKEDEE